MHFRGVVLSAISEFHFAVNEVDKLAYRKANLLHRVAVTDGYAVVGGCILVADRFKVDGDAERSAYLVLT